MLYQSLCTGTPPLRTNDVINLPTLTFRNNAGATVPSQIAKGSILLKESFETVGQKKIAFKILKDLLTHVCHNLKRTFKTTKLLYF